MTEAEWEACTDAVPMLDFLRAGAAASDRKTRLWACACCRRLLHLFPDYGHRRHVDVAELYADAMVSESELLKAKAAWPWGFSLNPGVGCEPDDLTWVAADRPAEMAAQCQFLQDIFGNPFRPLPAPDPAWLAWNCVVVRTLAQSAYDDRELPSGHLDATRLAMLADALEDSGCSDAGMLEHLRSAGPHVRGCWAVDVVLGKT